MLDKANSNFGSLFSLRPMLIDAAVFTSRLDFDANEEDSTLGIQMNHRF
jgi:hypothetical protein